MCNRWLIVSALALCGAVSFSGDVHAQLRTRAQASGFISPVAFVQDPTDRRV